MEPFAVMGREETIRYAISVEDVERIESTMKNAREAFETWSVTTVQDRVGYLGRLRQYLINHLDEIVDEICMETGKSAVDALISDMFATIDMIKYYEKNAVRLLRNVPVKTPVFTMPGKKSWIEYAPIGVVAVIAPWNFPFNLAVVPVVTALAAGNTVILKPSELAVRVGSLVEKIFHEVGFPTGVFNLLQGGPETGRQLILSHPDKIWFTGSIATGKKILEAAAENLIPASLELSGKDPMIIFEDAHLERAVNGAVWGSLTNCGQVCLSVERIYVQNTIYDEFLSRLLEKVRTIRQGSDPFADVGRLISPAQKAIITEQLKDARKQGAIIVTGDLPEDEASLYFPPTIMTGVDHSMRIMQEETFGPIMPIMQFSTEEEAIRLANDSIYGLGTSVWTTDLTRAKRVVRQLQTGGACINDVIENFGNPYLPFGGVKCSGMGRYHGPEGIYAFCQSKSIVMDRGTKSGGLHWYPYSREMYLAVSGLIRSLYGDGFHPMNLIKSVRRLLKTI